MSTISGVIKDASNAFVKRLVRAYRRDTGAFVGQTLSDPTTGAYSLTTADTTEHFVLTHDTADADLYWSQTALALHMDGADNSTTFTDLKGKTVTANGNARISTTQSKFGGASAYFDGAGDYLSIPASSDFGFGTGDFTIEGWIYPVVVTGSDRGITDFRSGTLAGVKWTFFIDNATGGKLAVWDGTTKYGSTGAAIPAGAWMHIALVRSSGVLKAYINGAMDFSTSLSSDLGSSNPLGIGGHSSASSPGSSPFSGYIDDLRITKGAARYTADFTPPTAHFSTTPSGGTENAVIIDRVVPV